LLHMNCIYSICPEPRHRLESLSARADYTNCETFLLGQQPGMTSLAACVFVSGKHHWFLSRMTPASAKT